MSEQPPIYNVDPDRLTVDLLLKNPSVAVIEPDGTRTELAPDPRWLDWSTVPLIADPQTCEHVETLCAECADSWGIDYYMKISVDGRVVWTSPDMPAEQQP